MPFPVHRVKVIRPLLLARHLAGCNVEPNLSVNPKSVGATKPNLSVCSYQSVKYWCGGAALMPKLGFCGWDCAGFGMCAAWVGLAVGLDMSESVQI